MIPIHDDQPSGTQPRVTIGIIVACVLVFLWQLTQTAGNGEAVFYSYGLIPAVLFGTADLPPELAVLAPWMTIFSSMFMHGGFMHLAGNMLYLWIFGNNVEDAMGHFRFFVFYVLCGVAAAMAQAFAAPGSEIPMIGASGAIGGVLGAYFLLHPNARVLVIIPLGFIMHPMRIPAWIVLGIWFVFQLIASGGTSEGGGVAYWAHIGGFATGMVLVIFFKRRDVRLWNFSGPQLSVLPGFENTRWDDRPPQNRSPFRIDPDRKHFNPFDDRR
ncbi:MAG: rhomboid family intramembrane serine protease [Alphaproteobacteria bacterium]|nr:rhomboid family intramembrane serine protease [Alphaproteobacteria bacterium]